jgi:hypothetical protein
MSTETLAMRNIWRSDQVLEAWGRYPDGPAN